MEYCTPAKLQRNQVVTTTTEAAPAVKVVTYGCPLGSWPSATPASTCLDLLPVVGWLQNHQLHATCHMPPLAAAWKCLWQWFIQCACALVDPKFQWKQTSTLPSFVCATKCHNMRWQGNSSLRAFNGNASPPLKRKGHAEQSLCLSLT